MDSKLIVPEFTGFGIGNEHFVLGRRPVNTRYSRLGLEHFLYRFPYFSLSNPREEFLFAKISGRKLDHPIYVDPILVSANVPVVGHQEGLGKYFIQGADPYLDGFGETKTDLVLSDVRIERKENTILILAGNARELRCEGESIFFDPEEICVVDGIPIKSDKHGKFYLKRKKGIRPVIMAPEHNLDATSDFDYFGIVKPRIRLAQRDQSIDPKKIIEGLVERGDLIPSESLTYMRSGEHAETAHSELVEYLGVSGLVTVIEIDGDHLVFSTEDPEIRDLIETMVRHRTLEKERVYVFNH